VALKDAIEKGKLHGFLSGGDLRIVRAEKPKEHKADQEQYCLDQNDPPQSRDILDQRLSLAPNQHQRHKCDDAQGQGG